MNSEQNVVKFYVLCNKLKTLVRTGWKEWKVNSDRLESVAEHIFGVQMLAIAMHSEYRYKLDLQKALFMIAVHELEEIMIGDYTPFDISKEEKNKLGHVCVAKILEPLIEGDVVRKLILEFDERKTKEAKFAHMCDKLECDLQCKVYDEQGCVDVKKQDNIIVAHSNNIQEKIAKGDTWSKMWMTTSRERYAYDENFAKVSDYAINNKILDLKKAKK